MIMTTEYWCCNSWWCARNHCHHLQESLIWMILRLCSGFASEKCIPWHPMRIRHCNNGLTFNVGGVGFSSHSCRRFLWLALLVCPQATVATSSGTYNNLVWDMQERRVGPRMPMCRSSSDPGFLGSPEEYLGQHLEILRGASQSSESHEQQYWWSQYTMKCGGEVQFFLTHSTHTRT